MEFSITIKGKTLIFDSELAGVQIDGKEYLSAKGTPLIYYQLLGHAQVDSVRLQLSSNTSTLIPSLRVLGIEYPDYFDQEPVVASQNDITFYWQKSKLAAFYNRYSTDNIVNEQRERVIRDAVDFLTSNEDLVLPEEHLAKKFEPCILLGFYEGFPIFDGTKGMAKLLSRVGIHVDPESVMISTPLDEHGEVVYRVAGKIENVLGIKGNHKKNRVTFTEKGKVLAHILEA